MGTLPRDTKLGRDLAKGTALTVPSKDLGITVLITLRAGRKWTPRPTREGLKEISKFRINHGLLNDATLGIKNDSALTGTDVSNPVAQLVSVLMVSSGHKSVAFPLNERLKSLNGLSVTLDAGALALKGASSEFHRLEFTTYLRIKSTSPTERNYMNNENNEPSEDFPIRQMSPEVFASCQRGNQVALIIPSAAVDGIELFQTLDEDRIIIGVPMKMIRRRMSFEQVEQVLKECEDEAFEFFGWEV